MKRRLLLAVGLVLLSIAVVAPAVMGVIAIDETAETPAYTATETATSSDRGVEFTLSDIPAQPDTQRLVVNLSAEASGITSVRLEQSNGAGIATKSPSNGQVTFEQSLSAGTYRITAQGADLHTPSVINDPALPYTSPNGRVNITAGVALSTRSDKIYNVRSITIETVQDDTQPGVTNPTPAGGATVTETPVNLSVDVSDPAFDTFAGDTVTVEFIDEDANATINTKTISSNQTVTTEFPGATAGLNNWSVVATDSYGNQYTSATFTFGTPAELEIRDEQAPGQLVTAKEVTIEFYPQGTDGTVVERNATDGTVDMDGLSANTEFIAVATADGYESRRIYIDSLIETQTVYLLNTSADSVDVQFELDDFSGRYQQATSVLVVEREINGAYTPIQGDFFGAAGSYSATLVRDTRYRLRIRNLETGAETVIGTLTPQTSGEQTLTIEPSGEVQLTEQSERVSGTPAVGVIAAAPDAALGVEIAPGDQPIEQWNITVEHRAPDGNTTVLATRAGSGATTEQFSFNLTGKEGIVVAEVDTTTTDGTQTTLVTRAIRANYPAANGLLGGLESIGGGLNAGDGSSGASSMASFLLSVLVTAGVGARSGSVELTGLAALGSLSGFAIIGWLSMQVLFASAVGFGAVLLLRRGI
jgi:hypothetical protein